MKGNWIDGVAIVVSFCCTILFMATTIGAFAGARWGLAFMAVVSLILFVVLLVFYDKTPPQSNRKGRNG